MILRLGGLMLLNAFGLILFYTLLLDGDAGLGIIILIITLGFDVIILVPGMYPLRWMSPGLALMVMLVIYPVLYTIQTAFTNYGDGHLFEKGQSVELIAERGYVPENASTYTYTPYRSGDDYALWLVDDTSGEVYFVKPGGALEPVDLASFGFQLVPSAESNGYTVLEQPGPLIGAIGGQTREFAFGEPVGMIAVSMSAPESVTTEARYVIQPTQGMIYDRETETSVPVTVLQNGDNFGFTWKTESGDAILARPGEPVYVNNTPVLDGYTISTAASIAEAGVESLSYQDPIGEIVISAIDPVMQDSSIYTIFPRFVVDSAQGLALDQRFGTVYDVAMYQNEAGETAYWLTESGGAARITIAQLVLPGENMREVELDDRRVLQTLNIDLPAGATIPNRIQSYTRIGVTDELYGQTIEAVTTGFTVEEVDFDRGYVFDLEQGLIINYETGTIYHATVYQSDDGSQFALWLESDPQPKAIRTVLARPDETLFVNGAPIAYEGYEYAFTTAESNPTIFLQSIGVDYYGEPDTPSNQRIGIISNTQAGQPYLLRYIYSEAENAFVDLSTIDAATIDFDNLDFETTSPYDIPGFLSATQYISDDEDGTFDAVRLRFVYSEVADAWVDMRSVSAQDTSDLTGEQIATQSLDSIPGFETAQLYVEYPDQGVFVPRNFVYNAGLDAFIQDGEGLENASADELAAAGLTYYVQNAETGLYIPPSWVYNETSDQFANLSGLDLASLDLEGVNLTLFDPEQVDFLVLDALTIYQRFDAQKVYAPQTFVYNSEANAFIDADSFPPMIDTSTLDLANDDISADAYKNADVYIYDDATDSFIPRQYTYIDAVESYVEVSDVEDLLGAPLADFAPQQIEDAVTNAEEPIRTYAVSVLREPLLYESDVKPLYNEKIGGYLYFADTDMQGVDLATFNPETFAALQGVALIPNQPSSTRISPIVYGSTLHRMDLGADRYITEVNSDASALSPGYRVGIGLENFSRIVSNKEYFGPLLDIFVWTVTFALMSVLLTFAMGLFMAIIMNDDTIPGKKVIRSLLIIPYAIPGVIGILVWQGMLNQNLGIITNAFGSVFGVRPQWFTDPTLAKLAILLVNLWLGYPYMMLVSSGALQAIPSDVYEAAAVDGAKPMQRFWGITLPLLLVTVGPLLIASFTFNFNNYLMIELLTRGDPPIPGTPTPAGYTDILISYTYNLAFGTDRGAQYGYASAITIVIFALVALVTLFQFRFTRQWEEVGENV